MGRCRVCSPPPHIEEAGEAVSWRSVFLDDSPQRRYVFSRMFLDGLAVETAARCIEALAVPCGHLYLDHDLGGEEHADPKRADTGMEVVRWIAANRPAIEYVTVHSLNVSAAERMVAGLRDAGYNALRVPWLVLLEEWK